MDNNQDYTDLDSKQENIKENKYGMWSRFYISYLWCFPIYMIFVIIGTPKEIWVFGFIGSAILSFLSGVLGMFMPTQRKLVFVSLSLIIVVLMAGLLGIYIAPK